MRRHLRFEDWQNTVASAERRAATLAKLTGLLRECEAALTRTTKVRRAHPTN